MRRAVSLLVVLSLLAAPLSATWSIVVVDTATGEVAIGIATCLAGFDLQPNTMVVVPGFGVAAAQSFVGPLSLRQLIRAELLAGTPPSQILALLAAGDVGHQGRQYGIAAVSGGAITFTGSNAFAWAGGVTGQVGSLVYAIQGNVLTGQPVVTAAEAALLNTAGDVPAKLMAAMEAARLMGGDGRCSCSQSNPPGCGSPPPSFATSALIGSMIVSRPGDVDAPCTTAAGCTAGFYFMDLNVANQPANAPDAVLQLTTLFNAFRTARIGHADHFQSTISLADTELPANGVATTTATVVLRDWSGTPIGFGGANVTASVVPGPASAGVLIGPVVDHGDGSYSFGVTAGATPGDVKIRVTANDGVGSVRLGPEPTLSLGAPFGPCGEGSVDDGAGGLVDTLFVDGSPGVRRVVSLGVAQPFTVSVAPPPGLAAAPFVLWTRFAPPSPAYELALDPSIGTLCFAGFPLVADPNVLLVADSFGGQGALPATPAPWTVTFPAGVPVPARFLLQGAMLETAAPSFGVTNAVVVDAVLLAPPTLTAATPGSAAAGATVSLTGTGFQPGASVTVNGLPAVETVLGPTAATFVMPAGVGCPATVVLTNPDTQSASRVINPAPGIVNAIPSSASAAGGVTLILVGSNFVGSTATVGGTAATVAAASAFSMTLTLPPGTPGATTIVVTSPAGCTATFPFTYL